MTLSGVCTIQLKGDQHLPFDVAFAFDDTQVPALRGYVDEAMRLEQSVLNNGGFGVSLNVSWKSGEEVALAGKEPTDDQLAIFLHRMRPFVLQGEPLHFGRIKNVVTRGTRSSEFMQKYLDRAKDLFTGKGDAGPG